MANPMSEKQSKKNRSPRLYGAPEGYLYAMSHAEYGEPHWFQLLPAAFFTAVVIMIVRMHTYTRPMDQFFWTNGSNDLSDFFSYFKMIAIIICSVLALLLLLYRTATQTLTIKRCFAYIPMAVYSLFVLFSYLGSEYKEFALLGWNDRFEGTIPLLCYMVMLFFVINTIDSERSVKTILYPLAATSGLLSLLGITQALDHDFFRTSLGKKLITPSWYWPHVDELTFNFQDKQIYQTVYNINYVSFYLTLLIPLFGMLFILSINKGKEEPFWKKAGLGVLFAMLIYNLIGSASSGGYLGLGVIGLLGIVLLNKKIIQWWKPVTVLLVIALAVSGLTYDRWLPELTSAVRGTLGTATTSSEENENTEQAKVIKPMIDYFETGKDTITMSLYGNAFTLQVYTDSHGQVDGIAATDEDDKPLTLTQAENMDGLFLFNDERFIDYVSLTSANYDGLNYIILNTTDMQWPFAVTEDGLLYRNQLGKLLPLRNVSHMGWATETNFGNGRGYIWSRTLPLMKDTLFLGKGADTFCIDFPHDDYAGKYSTPAFTESISIIVDKPHNMYMGAAVGTGGISLLALLALWIMYIVQSIQLYWRAEFKEDFLTYTGSGIFFGICGFLATGLVDDSSVSVMPMFYGLLGTGIAINIILKKRLKESASEK